MPVTAFLCFYLVLTKARQDQIQPGKFRCILTSGLQGRVRENRTVYLLCAPSQVRFESSASSVNQPLILGL